jgi:tRNA nucleotidyltransferase (CCA-adding enzyme)
VRFYPRDRKLRQRVPAGIEVAPPRREVSTGPGRHDFEIVVDPNATVEEDLGRRDFTVNALARRLADGTLVDPYGGELDLHAGVLRTVSPNSFAEDPLRLVRGLRFVSQLGLEPDDATLAQMRAEAPSVALVSGERIGGGLAADGLGELSKLLLGA